MCQPTADPGDTSSFWRPGDSVDKVKGTGANIANDDVYACIEKRIAELDEDLRQISLDIHGACLGLADAIAP